ncbi:hypothetical protein [Sphingomonas arantia]|uniref:hypothetical protein n=1 Tax=Sphingomonas arantia TaxID=1460676 RepID=UPI0036D215D8
MGRRLGGCDDDSASEAVDVKLARLDRKLLGPRMDERPKPEKHREADQRYELECESYRIGKFTHQHDGDFDREKRHDHQKAGAV